MEIKYWYRNWPDVHWFRYTHWDKKITFYVSEKFNYPLFSWEIVDNEKNRKKEAENVILFIWEKLWKVSKDIIILCFAEYTNKWIESFQEYLAESRWVELNNKDMYIYNSNTEHLVKLW